MKIGLFFGSFNPIHTGHLIIANHILNSGKTDKVWFIVSPQNPFKNSELLLDPYDRLVLTRAAISSDRRMKVSDVEFGLSQPSYTINTLLHLRKKFPGDKFLLIMGSDTFKTLGQWWRSPEIISNYEILVYSRPGFKITKRLRGRIQILDAPLLEISSTEIRNLIKAGKSARYLVPDNVLKEIKKRRFYRK